MDPRQRFDAAVLIGIDTDDPLVAGLAARDVPLVGVDVRCPGKRTAYVGSDHAEGVRLALAHLHVLGHRRIAHVAGAQNTVAGVERLNAFRSETERLGLTVPEGYLRLGDFSSASGYREACALLALAERPTGIVAASDLMALAALQAIREAGFEPDGTSLSSGSTISKPRRSHTHPSRRFARTAGSCGTLAAAMAMQLIEDPEATEADGRPAGRARRARLFDPLGGIGGMLRVVGRAARSGGTAHISPRPPENLDRAEHTAYVHLGRVVPAMRTGGVEQGRRAAAGAACAERDPHTPGTLTGSRPRTSTRRPRARRR